MKYSILSLLYLTMLFTFALSFATKRTVPDLNQLFHSYEEDFEIYEVESAAYGIHIEGEIHFLTAKLRASREVSLDPNSCHLEFSIPFPRDPSDQVVAGAVFDIPVYDEELFNLNYFYRYDFDDMLGGRFKVNRIDETGLDGSLIANGGTLTLRARFEKQDSMARSFD